MAHGGGNRSDPIRSDPIVVRTLDLIQARACDRWFRLQDAADALGVSPWVISVRIKRATGRSFPQHVHDRRIHWARLWLTDRRPSCKEIAARTGYDRPADFAREFRRRLDCSPLCFRRLLQLEAGRTGSVDLAALIAGLTAERVAHADGSSD